MIARQPFGGRIVAPDLAIESGQPASPGARPNNALSINGQRDDVIGIKRDIDAGETHLFFLTRVMR